MALAGSRHEWSYLKRVDALIFDCDGTLVSSSDIHFRAMGKALQEQDFELEPGTYHHCAGMARAHLFAHVAAAHGRSFDLDLLCARSISLTVDMVGEVRSNPVVEQIARRWHARLPLALATNSETAIARGFLAALGLMSLFRTVVAREDVAAPKPAPDIFLKAAARLGCAPEKCLVLEDSVQGIAAARAAGMKVIDVTSRSNRFLLDYMATT